MTAIAIKLTPSMGRGVFAARAIAQGETLGEFYTIRIPPAEVAAMGGSTLSHFWFEDDGDGAAFVVLGWIELVNHAHAPNLERTWHQTPEGEVVSVLSKCAIAAGEQLFIDYRFDPKAKNPDWA